VTRRCGPCSACCTALQVEAINKPECSRCEHQRNGWKACAIYDDRPDGCRTFECDWLRGKMASRDRPDQLGLIVTAQPGGFVCWETRKGARSSSRALFWLAQFAGVARVVVIAPDGTRSQATTRER
jgi:hypothetical protein